MFSGLFESCFEIDLSSNDQSEITQALKLSPLPSSKGTLLFADDQNTPIQLLLCANIRRTATARLFPEDEVASKRADLRSIVRRIYYTRCFNDLRNTLFHYNAAKAIYPKTFGKILKLARQTFVKIDTAANWPIFKTTEEPADSTQHTFCPFPTRQAANDFVGILQNAYDLCQMPSLLPHPDKAKSCPYLQMDKCPGPCIGNISKIDYLTQIDSAIDAAAANLNEQIQSLHNKMLDASQKMEFESAQHIKKQIDQLKLLLKDDYKWTTDLNKFKVLHIDRSARLKVKKRTKQQLFAAFLIRANSITELGDFAPDAFEHLPELINSQLLPQESSNPKDILSIICYHLYRSSQQGIWIDCSQNIPTAEQITDQIIDRFQKQTDTKQA